jgi:hypothetical protein
MIRATAFRKDRAVAILDSLQNGDDVEAPEAIDGDPEWGLHDLLMLAGACLYLARVHPDIRDEGDHERRKNETSAAADEYGLLFAAVELGIYDEDRG